MFDLRLYMKVNSYKRDRGNREKVCGSIISIIKSVLYDCNLIAEPKALIEKLFVKAESKKFNNIFWVKTYLSNCHIEIEVYWGGSLLAFWFGINL